MIAFTLALDRHAGAADLQGDRNRELAEQGWTIDEFRVEDADQAGLRRIHAQARFAVPAEAIWQVIRGENRGSTRWPGIKESELLWARGDSTICRYALDVPIFRDRHYDLLNIERRESMILDFEMVPGYGNVAEIQGRWNITPVSDDLSYVEYRLDTDPGVSLVPGFIVRWATRRAIPRSFGYLYKRALDLVESKPELGERHR